MLNKIKLNTQPHLLKTPKQILNIYVKIIYNTHHQTSCKFKLGSYRNLLQKNTKFALNFASNYNGHWTLDNGHGQWTF